jgi:hypothetical protein
VASYFKHHPVVNYDMYLDSRPQKISNVLVSFTIQKLLKDKTVIYYPYSIKESDRPDIISQKYYDDPTLDWILYATNKIVNPLWEWPLNYVSFQNYLKNKYGSVGIAQTTVERYEKILSTQTILPTGEIIPEKVVTIDYTTFLATPSSETRTIYAYGHEEDLNDDRRNVKILDKRYINLIVSESEKIFD